MSSTTASRISYLGPAGTFTEQACRALPEAVGLETVPRPTVAVALDDVRTGASGAAVVPIENSVEGSVPVTLDELATGAPLIITAEVTVPVSFSLLVRPGTTIDRVSTVGTHPHAEAQTRRWLAEHLPQASVVHTTSTAAAAAALVDPAAPAAWDAAIAAPPAAEHYRLETLATGLGDNPDALTRFVLVSPPGPPRPPTGRDKTSLVAFMRQDHPGALLEILEQLTMRGVNLTRIESRPDRRRAGGLLLLDRRRGPPRGPPGGGGADGAAAGLRRRALPRLLRAPRRQGAADPPRHHRRRVRASAGVVGAPASRRLSPVLRWSR